MTMKWIAGVAAVVTLAACGRVYYYIDELNQQEIADFLGCSRRTVGCSLERLGDWTRAQEEAC